MKAVQRHERVGMGGKAASFLVNAVGNDAARFQIDGHGDAASVKVIDHACIRGGTQRSHEDMRRVAVGIGGEAHGVEAVGIEAVKLRVLRGHLLDEQRLARKLFVARHRRFVALA